MTQQITWNTDLTKLEPLPRSKRPKKDHKCPHDRKHPTGMEVCRACGDYGICCDCGMEYIKQDSYGGPRCWMCEGVLHLRRKLREAEREQAKRKAEHMTPAEQTEEARA